MQNPDKYLEHNDNTTHGSYFLDLLKEHEHLFSWGPDEVVLDAGCGPGDVTSHLLQPWLPHNFRLLLGIDVSASMVQHALSQHCKSDKVSFAIADMESDMSHLLHNNSLTGFDKVFSYYTLVWLFDIEAGIKNIHSIMKPGGQALLVFPLGRLFQKTFKQVCDQERWRTYFKDINREVPTTLLGPNPCGEFEDMMKKVGFEVIKCESRKNDRTYDTMNIFKVLVESLDFHIGRVPSSLKSQYLDDCVRELEDMKVLIKDGCSVTLKRYNIICVAKKPITEI